MGGDGSMLKLLEGFHHRAARSIAGMMARNTTGGEWEFPLVAYVLENSWIWPIKEYIYQRQAKISAKVT